MDYIAELREAGTVLEDPAESKQVAEFITNNSFRLKANMSELELEPMPPT